MATIIPSRQLPARRRAARAAGEDYGRSALPSWRDIDWREHLRHADVGGRRLNFVDIGVPDGDALILIHGLSGRWANWLENIPFFAQDRRVIAVDLPGFGDSEMPAERISITGYARCVEELCEQLDLGRADIVGNSMGGFVGAEMGIRYPDRVDGLVLVSAAGISIVNLRRDPLIAAAKMLAAAGAASAAQRRAVLSRPAWTHAAFSIVFRHPTRMPRELLYEQMLGAGKDGFVPAMEALTSYDFTDRLPEVGARSLVVWGENDMLVPVGDAYEFERLIPDARALVLHDTGHCAMLERPDTFNRHVKDFLDRRGAPSGAHGEETASA